jgi:dipeptidase D
MEGTLCTITIGGLKSGHSGTDIHLELGNANILMGRVLYGLSKVTELGIVTMEGGNADNVICQECVAEIVVADAEKAAVEIEKLDAILKNEYKTADPAVFVKAEIGGKGVYSATDGDSTSRMLGFLMTTPYGVQHMSVDIKDLTETSLNLGALKLEENEMTALYALRSSVMTRQDHLQDKLELTCRAFGGTVEYNFFYPAWEFRKDSPLRDVCVRVFEEMFGKTPLVEAIHAGLECGIFAGKMGGEFDAVSIGPEMSAVHTADEKLSISSTERMWKYLLQILKECK